MFNLAPFNGAISEFIATKSNDLLYLWIVNGYEIYFLSPITMNFTYIK